MKEWKRKQRRIRKIGWKLTVAWFLGVLGARLVYWVVQRYLPEIAFRVVVP